MLYSALILAAASVCVAAGQRVAPGQLPAPGGPIPGYEPIHGKQRLRWFAVSSFGPASLTGGLISAGFGTAFNVPKEYGPHWQGFGERYGMRLTGVVTGNAMEAGVGALWGEDPRYLRAAGQPFGRRVSHVVKMAFLSESRDGHLMPAYARYIAAPANNFLSNAWREPSEATTGHAIERTGLGFLSRMAGNAFAEFWPDVTKHLHRRSSP